MKGIKAIDTHKIDLAKPNSNHTHKWKVVKYFYQTNFFHSIIYFIADTKSTKTFVRCEYCNDVRVDILEGKWNWEELQLLYEPLEEVRTDTILKLRGKHERENH